jgi:hypothetical protein
MNLQKIAWSEIPVFNEQLTMLWHHSTNQLAGLNMNIPINMRECFTITDFWATPYYISPNKSMLDNVGLVLRKIYGPVCEDGV